MDQRVSLARLLGPCLTVNEVVRQPSFHKHLMTQVMANLIINGAIDYVTLSKKEPAELCWIDRSTLVFFLLILAVLFVLGTAGPCKKQVAEGSTRPVDTRYMRKRFPAFLCSALWETHPMKRMMKIFLQGLIFPGFTLFTLQNFTAAAANWVSSTFDGVELGPDGILSGTCAVPAPLVPLIAFMALWRTCAVVILASVSFISACNLEVVGGTNTTTETHSHSHGGKPCHGH